MLNMMKKDLKELVSNKIIWFVLCIVLIIIVISTTFVGEKQDDGGEDSTSITIGVLDLDNSNYSKLLLSYFEENEALSSYISLVKGTADELNEMMIQNSLDMYLEIPKDFVTNMVQIEHAPIKVYINTYDSTKALLIKNLLQSYEKYVAAVEIGCVTLYEVMELSKMPQELIDEKNVEISYDLIFTAISKDAFFKEVNISDISAIPLKTYYVYEAIYLIICYLSVMLGIQFLRERQKGIYKRLLTTGTSMTGLVVGKIFVFAGFCELIIILLSTLLHFTSGGGPKFQTVLLISMFLWISCAICVFISACIKNIATYLLSMNLIIIFGAIIGGGIIPLSFLPKELYQIASKTPNAWFIKEMIRFQGPEANGFDVSLISIALAFIGFVLLSGAMYRRREANANDKL